MPLPSKDFRDLCSLIASIKSEKEAALLLKDLLTPQELDSLTERWQLIQELAKGTPQREIAQKLHISISKITRGSHALKYGAGGFRRFLKRARAH
ncbi:MAG: Trp family transcriptional regulator [Candidatus Peregrinibacteria bacterium]|nr:Trp family transcriptional regulator [Candidatus Peregrinibacteria bacterium]